MWAKAEHPAALAPLYCTSMETHMVRLARSHLCKVENTWFDSGIVGFKFDDTLRTLEGPQRGTMFLKVDLPRSQTVCRGNGRLTWYLSSSLVPISRRSARSSSSKSDLYCRAVLAHPFTLNTAEAAGVCASLVELLRVPCGLPGSDAGRLVSSFQTPRRTCTRILCMCLLHQYSV